MEDIGKKMAEEAVDNMNNYLEQLKPHIHRETGCEHGSDLIHCNKCDVVWCQKCGAEWEKSKHVNLVPSFFKDNDNTQPLSHG